VNKNISASSARADLNHSLGDLFLGFYSGSVDRETAPGSGAPRGEFNRFCHVEKTCLPPLFERCAREVKGLLWPGLMDGGAVAEMN
jgi:hypothetical protein